MHKPADVRSLGVVTDLRARVVAWKNTFLQKKDQLIFPKKMVILCRNFQMLFESRARFKFEYSLTHALIDVDAVERVSGRRAEAVAAVAVVPASLDVCKGCG